MADNDRHPGITIHKLPVGGGFAGLVFAVGSMLIFVVGFPSLWYFVALSAAMGVAVAVVLRLINKGRSERLKPLSNLFTAPVAESPGRPRQDRNEGRKERLQRTFPVLLPIAANSR